MAGNVLGATYPYNAILAWQPYDSSNDHWDNSLTGHVFPGSAKWIWASYWVVNPIAGDIVDFKKDTLYPGQPFSANITGLGKGTKYYFRAQAKNTAGTGSSSELSFLTKPDAPTAFTASVISSTQIDLSWTKGEGANRTMVRRRTGSYPTDRNDGVQVYFDTGTSVSDTTVGRGVRKVKPL